MTASKSRPQVTTVPRPYTLAYASGNAYPLSSEDAQRLIDSYPIVTASRNRVELRGDDGTRSVILPATLGGGPAFEVKR